jgi:hypothetical protein
MIFGVMLLCFPLMVFVTLLFIDAHTKYIWYYPLVAKSVVFPIFQRFQLIVER